MKRLGLRGGDYLLYVGRFVPEKRADLLLDAFAELRDRTGLKLVLAGASSFSDTYAADLAARARADDRVVLPGYVYGEELEELYSNARCFVQPSDLEGLPLTLLESHRARRADGRLRHPPAPRGCWGPARPGTGCSRAATWTGLTDAFVGRPRWLPATASSPARDLLADRVRRDYSWDQAAQRTLELYLDDARVPVGAVGRG